jgi:acetylornithine deacetylase
LISFDTVSRHSNLELIRWIQEHLDALGVESSLIFDETGQKANLFATIGPSAVPGYVLSGHTDVVPVEGQEWATNPFEVVQRDGRLFGRGTSDMKSFIAVVLASVPLFLRAKLSCPIHLAFSYDEEIGCRGVPSLLEFIRDQRIKPKLCIVGEPTDMQVVTAHKGNKRYRCAVRGHECHSALANRGVNAVEAACELVAKLKAIARRKAAEGPFDQEFDPPYTTVHTGVIQGGTALNIVPKHCYFEFEFRFIPDEDPLLLLEELKSYARATLEAEMQIVNPDAGIEFSLKSQLLGLSTSPSDEGVGFAKALSNSTRTGKISFGSEGGLFQAAGIPTIICGPGSIEQAHKPDEWITLEQIAQCESFMARLAKELTVNS